MHLYKALIDQKDINIIPGILTRCSRVPQKLFQTKQEVGIPQTLAPAVVGQGQLAASEPGLIRERAVTTHLTLIQMPQ